MDFTKLIADPTPAPEASPAPVAETSIQQPSDPAVAPPVPTEQPPTPNNEIAAVPPAEAEKQTAVDYNAYLDAMSAGVIKDEEGFKAILPRLTEYDSLKAKNEELSAAMAKAPVFANDHVRIFNDLVASGATAEQLKSFQKINEYGNIDDMPDRDSLIAKMVMIDGVKENIAAIKVEREFQLKDENLDETEREILDEDMRLASVKAKAELNKFKAELSTTNKVTPEEQRLQQEVAMQNHVAQLKPYVKEVANSITSLGTFTLKGKTEADAIPLTVKMPEDFKPTLEQALQNYFADGLTPPTPENTREAISYAHAEYIRANLPNILQGVKDDLENVITERLVNKYENRSGLKPNVENPVVPVNVDAETATWFSNRVNRVGAK